MKYQLIISLVQRDVVARYKGSMLGIIWVICNPIIMLLVYGFVFGVVFESRWGDIQGKGNFAIVLFLGLITFNFFGETVNRAPSLLLENVNYIKKVVFPLEIIPVVSVLTSLFFYSINFFVWLVFYCILNGFPPKEVLYIPLILIPYVVFVLGLVYFISALGVYLRDIGQFLSSLITAMLFLSPIFYPISAIPERYQEIILLNPISLVIESTRALAISGEIPALSSILILWLGSFGFILVGYLWFKGVQKGFADVA